MAVKKDEMDEKRPMDFGGEGTLSHDEMDYSKLLTEKNAIAQKNAYESTPKFKVKKYVTPMRNFSSDVLGIMKKIPRYEHEVRSELGKTRQMLAGAKSEERRIESELGKSLGTDEWDMWDDEGKQKKKKTNKYGEDWSGLDWKI